MLYNTVKEKCYTIDKCSKRYLIKTRILLLMMVENKVRNFFFCLDFAEEFKYLCNNSRDEENCKVIKIFLERKFYDMGSLFTWLLF